LSLCAMVAGVAQRQNAATMLKMSRFLLVFIIDLLRKIGS
jgi:hypothetical protein